VADEEQLPRVHGTARRAVEELELLSGELATSGDPRAERIHHLAAAAMIITWEIGNLLDHDMPERLSRPAFEASDREPIDRAVRRWAEFSGLGRPGGDAMGAALRHFGQSLEASVEMFSNGRWMTVEELRRRFPTAESISDVAGPSGGTPLFEALSDILGWKRRSGDSVQ
jgi:hypothetical protein